MRVGGAAFYAILFLLILQIKSTCVIGSSHGVVGFGVCFFGIPLCKAVRVRVGACVWARACGPQRLRYAFNSQQCHSCRKLFDEAERKHHCRACGEGFCQACSSHRMPVPEKGWGSTPVRVCEVCHRQGGAPTTTQGRSKGEGPYSFSGFCSWKTGRQYQEQKELLASPVC